MVFIKSFFFLLMLSVVFASIDDERTGSFNDLEADISDLGPDSKELDPGFNVLGSAVQSDARECKPPGTGCIWQVKNQSKQFCEKEFE